MTWSGRRATRIRRILARTLPRPCWRCARIIYPTDAWDVGHVVAIAEGGGMWDPANLAPECRGPCNRADGARITNDRRSQTYRRIRPW